MIRRNNKGIPEWELVFDALGLATEKENSVVEVCTGDLDSVLKDLNSQSPVAIDAEGIFIASTVADVCCFDASLVEGLADDELYVDGKTFVALAKFLIQKESVLDYGTVNEFPETVTLHGDFQ